MERGLLIIISAPSGAGKTTLAKALVEAHPEVQLSVSHTTRTPRAGERDGVDYYFVDDGTFDNMVADGAFLEWAHVHANRYGTSNAEVKRLRDGGVDVLFDVDYQGGVSIMAAHLDAISVFVLPPSYEVLAQRIRDRGTDTEETIKRRLHNALHEMRQYGSYQYIVVNDDLDEARAAVLGIYRAAHHRKERMAAAAEAIIAETGLSPSASS
jgi:guanylate kinase